MNLFVKYYLGLNAITIRCLILKRCYSEASDVRVRFAPSPTGFLHLGGLRTALFNFLFSKSHNGTFVLRIEDTDQTRLVDTAVKKLEYDLEWAGVEPDESPSKGGLYGPYLQSQRLPLYKEEVKKLLNNGSAYYCFCNDRRLSLLKKDAIRRREVPKYDNRCRNLSEVEVQEKLKNGSSYCIRFKLIHFSEPINDLVYGNITHDIAAIEGDPIIIKTDGFPTYHFANVVDDHYMKITHVLRGIEWQPSTTKHLLLYRAFNWTPPQYAHLPLLMNEDGTKLSKRHSNMTVEAYRDDGIYPIALINFIISSGGGFNMNDSDNEGFKIRPLSELSKTFQLKSIVPHNCQLQYSKLDEFNRAAIMEMVSNETTLNDLVIEVKNMVEKHFLEKENIQLSLNDNRIKHILRWSTNRIFRLKDLISPEFSYLWIVPSEEILLHQEENCFKILAPLIKDLSQMGDFNETSFSNYFKPFAQEHGVKFATMMKFLRACLSGLLKGPSVGELMSCLGKEIVLQRLERAESFHKKRSTYR